MWSKLEIVQFVTAPANFLSKRINTNRARSQTSTVIKMLKGSTSTLPVYECFILSFAFFSALVPTGRGTNKTNNSDLFTLHAWTALARCLSD